MCQRITLVIHHGHHRCLKSQVSYRWSMFQNLTQIKRSATCFAFETAKNLYGQCDTNSVCTGFLSKMMSHSLDMFIFPLSLDLIRPDTHPVGLELLLFEGVAGMVSETQLPVKTTDYVMDVLLDSLKLVSPKVWLIYLIWTLMAFVIGYIGICMLTKVIKSSDKWSLFMILAAHFDQSELMPNRVYLRFLSLLVILSATFLAIYYDCLYGTDLVLADHGTAVDTLEQLIESDMTVCSLQGFEMERYLEQSSKPIYQQVWQRFQKTRHWSHMSADWSENIDGINHIIDRKCAGIGSSVQMPGLRLLYCFQKANSATKSEPLLHEASQTLGQSRFIYPTNLNSSKKLIRTLKKL